MENGVLSNQSSVVSVIDKLQRTSMNMLLEEETIIKAENQIEELSIVIKEEFDIIRNTKAENELQKMRVDEMAQNLMKRKLDVENKLDKYPSSPISNKISEHDSCLKEEIQQLQGSLTMKLQKRDIYSMLVLNNEQINEEFNYLAERIDFFDESLQNLDVRQAAALEVLSRSTIETPQATSLKFSPDVFKFDFETMKEQTLSELMELEKITLQNSERRSQLEARQSEINEGFSIIEISESQSNQRTELNFDSSPKHRSQNIDWIKDIIKESEYQKEDINGIGPEEKHSILVNALSSALRKRLNIENRRTIALERSHRAERQRAADAVDRARRAVIRKTAEVRRLDYLLAEVAKARADVSEASAALAEAKGAISRLERTAAVAAERMRTISVRSAKNQALRAKAESRAASIAENEGKLESKRARLAALRSEIDTLEAAVASMDGKSIERTLDNQLARAIKIRNVGF